ncbi:MAG: polysaccharide deacetylase family protein [Anaerolineales bacterium]|nr:polysaccharide deacetylase family protein [Anaerolineales bacterium]
MTTRHSTWLLTLAVSGLLAGCAQTGTAPASPAPGAQPPGVTQPPAATPLSFQPVAAEVTPTPAPTVTPSAAPEHSPSPEPTAERVPVIEYHYSTYTMGELTTMRTDWFLEQLDWLEANGYRTLTGDAFTAYLRGEAPVPARSVVLRFDVAQSHFEDYTDVIVPALRARGQHGLFFILASRTSDDCDGHNACWPTLKAWADEGVISPESHSLWHLDYATLPPEQIVLDAQRSRAIIEAKTGHTVHGLCYPFDSVAPAALDILRDLGYDFAVAGYTRQERGVLARDPDPYALPSIYPYSSDAAYPQLTSHPGETFATLLESFR